MPRVARQAVLSDADQGHLEPLIRQRSTGQVMALRARIVLMAANNGEIAVAHGTSQTTVGTWETVHRTGYGRPS